MASRGDELPTSASGPPAKQLQVLLKLQTGERSFGMSLAQRQPALGPKYTVVSTIFPNSPAARAGVREGCVVLCINDQPMSGLTVAQVASHFRNVPQTRITLEIVENETRSPAPGFAARAGVGFSMLAAKVPVLPIAVSTGSGDQRPKAPTGFAVASSGKAIAAPGSALAASGAAAPKTQVLRLGPKAAAKATAPSPPDTPVAPLVADTQKPVTAKVNASAATPKADSKVATGTREVGVKSTVAPVLLLGPKPTAVPSKDSTQKRKTIPAKPNAIKPGQKSFPNGTTANGGAISQSSIQEIEEPFGSINVPASKAQSKPVDTSKQTSTPQPKKATTPTASACTQGLSVPAPKVPIAPTPKADFRIAIAPKTITPKAAATKVAASSAAAPSTSGGQGTPVQGPSAKVGGAVTTPTGYFAKPTSSHPSRAIKPTVPASTARNVVEKARSTPILRQVETNTIKPSPVASTSKPSPESVKHTTKAPPRATVVPNTVMHSAPTPSAKSAVPSPPVPATAKPKTGRKRGRPKKNPVAPNTSSGQKSKSKAQRPPDEELNLDDMDDATFQEVFGFELASGAEDDETPKKSARRQPRNRRRGIVERHRHSLTIDRLLTMGFTREDAEASVKELGDNDPDACMVWIISKIEERQYNDDINMASIQSEQSKRDEEKRVKRLEKERLAHAKAFVKLFPTSYILSPESPASRLKKTLDSTIGHVDAETYLRELLAKLLKLEGQAIKWYKVAAKSYMLELAKRLEASLGTHDLLTCCARVSAGTAASTSCTFVRTLIQEHKALSKALFEMPSNQGGVPVVFLECDDAMQFSLDDDGFEVVD